MKKAELILPFVLFGVIVAVIENAFAAALYRLALENVLDRALFWLFFAAVQTLGWLVLGSIWAALMSLWSRSVRLSRTRLLSAGALTRLVLWVVVSLHGLLWANAFFLRYDWTAASIVVSAGVVIASVIVAALLTAAGRTLAKRGALTARGPAALAVGLLICTVLSFAVRAVVRTTDASAADGAPGLEERFPPAGTQALRLPPDTNILFLLVDTLRWDHLGYNGYERDTSPALDRLALGGVNFTQAIAQATRTSPNMASILTGLTTYSHGIILSRSILDDALTTWGEIMADEGYSTVAMLDNINMGSEFNYAQGIEHVDELFRGGGPRGAGTMLTKAMSWLESSREEPFFMWLHAMDPHTPYDPPPPYDTWFTGDDLYSRTAGIELEYSRTGIGGLKPLYGVPGVTSLSDYIARYDGEIRYTDWFVDSLLAGMDRLGLRENTLIIFTSDHGESLGEHEYYFAHGTFAFEPTAHVPLVLSHPDLPSGLTIDRLVRSIDILPSVLDLLGMPYPPILEGESFVPLLTGRETMVEEAPICAGGDAYLTMAARTDRWKLVLTPREWLGYDQWVAAKLKMWPNSHREARLRRRSMKMALYDLVSDPAETVDRSEANPSVARELHDQVCEWMNAALLQFRAVRLGEGDLSPEAVEQLRSLGYMQ